ncbi:hypothetical protein Pla111_03550 [Botrimarina hoheduenensis]|uniref:Double zinc ribbon n=2 Tax=Botrimarina hoheduenensis TaxID=2528000 RepID=A0A5C5WES8_9BACT|nr:hypothetical protein Pla111_03550 [Botrimarina hoheduenensis]
MLSIGICPVCAAGPLGLRQCGVCRRVVVLCDECDVAWRTDDPTRPGSYGQETMPCPGCSADLWTAGATWATREAVAATPWLVKHLPTLVESPAREPQR